MSCHRALQVVLEGGQSAAASARLVGRETLPLATPDMHPSTPALQRQSSSPQALVNKHPLDPRTIAASTAHLQSAASYVDPLSGEASASELLPSGGDGKGLEKTDCSCECAADTITSSDRAFVISTAETDWGVSVGTWGVSGPEECGGSSGQLQVQLHRLHPASGACTCIWRQTTSCGEVCFHSVK